MILHLIMRNKQKHHLVLVDLFNERGMSYIVLITLMSLNILSQYCDKYVWHGQYYCQPNDQVLYHTKRLEFIFILHY